MHFYQLYKKIKKKTKKLVLLGTRWLGIRWDIFYIFVMEMDIVPNESREASHFTVWKPHLLPSPYTSCTAHARTLALKRSSLHSVPGYLSRGNLHPVQVLKGKMSSWCLQFKQRISYPAYHTFNKLHILWPVQWCFNSPFTASVSLDKCTSFVRQPKLLHLHLLPWDTAGLHRLTPGFGFLS